MTRRGMIAALIQTITTGRLLTFEPAKELRVMIEIPLVITDGKTEVRLTPAEIMEALK